MPSECFRTFWETFADSISIIVQLLGLSATGNDAQPTPGVKI